MATAAGVLTLVLFLMVVRPAIERGGLGEFLGIAALFVAILLGERWLRSR
jgi:hypothetical protein